MRVFFAGCLLICGFFFLAPEETDYYGALKDLTEENAVLAFVRAELEKSGAAAAVKDFSGFADGHSFSHILQTEVPGQRRETLIVAAPALSGGSAFSAALALSLWRETRQTPPPVSLIFLFLGGDGDRFFPAGDGGDFPRENALGTRLFLESFFPQYPVSVLYLGFTELPGRILCETGTRGTAAPSWMLENAGISLKEAGLPFLITNRICRTLLAQSAARLQGRQTVLRYQHGALPTACLYGLKANGGQSPADEYLAAGFPALGLAGEGRAGNGDHAAWEKAFRAFFRSYLRLGADSPRREWDQRYLVFPYGPAYSILGEDVLAITLLCVSGAGILYACLARARLRRYAKLFLRNIWNVPLLFLLLVLFFMAGTAAVRLMAAFRNAGALWPHQPLVFFILKTSCAVFLFLLSLHWIRRLPLAKNSGFYSASAIFCSLTNVFLFGALDISLALFFLWPCAASVFFSFFRRAAPRIMVFLAALLPPCLLAHDTFFSGEKALAEVLIDSPLAGNLLLGIVFFPFLLMLIRIGLPGRHSRAAKSAPVLRACAGGVFLAALVFALAFNPWGESAQPLFVEEYEEPAEGLHELRLSSPFPLGKFTLAFGGENFSVDTGKTFLTLPLGASGKRPTRAASAGAFPDRKIHSILFEPPLKPEKITVHLSSDSPLPVYDCNFPYSLEANGRGAEVFIGTSPPLPLKLVLGLPARQTAGVRITSWSPLVSEGCEIEGKTFSRTSYSKLVDSFIIQADE
ncbi:MAG: hypothetical protein LBT33_11000 [Spirochaetia bacterium]|jgi:hypothetical protein|nr:hypothetical protein [Spirochaetia bacterium]